MIKEIQDKIDNYNPINEKDKIKFEHIIKNMEAISRNHLTNIATLPNQKWQKEVETTLWDERIKTYLESLLSF